MTVLSGKVFLITGASAGIGRATALLAARVGASVVIGDVDDEGGAQTVELIRAQNG